MLMRGIIINNNMQVLVPVRLCFNRLEEFKKLFMCMLLVTLAGHVTRGDIERCKECTGAVSFMGLRGSVWVDIGIFG